jgi:hypothetical protein
MYRYIHLYINVHIYRVKRDEAEEKGAKDKADEEKEKKR